MKALILDEMIWSELEFVRNEIKAAIVPVGSCEQHGPNTTFETDTARAYEFSKMIGARFGNKLLICPPVAYGISAHHMPFPGTITLRGETYINLICDIAVALDRQGIKKIIYLSGHGGNYTALDVAITKLKYDYNIDAFYSSIGGAIHVEAVTPEMEWSEIRGHACEEETSQAMVLCPWIVRDNRVAGEIVKPQRIFGNGPEVVYKWGGFAWNWKKDVTANGALGDARKANLEDGIRLNNLVLDNIEKMINAILDR